MPIVRAAFSHALTWRGNKPREILRSHVWRKGAVPLDDERVSPNKVNPLRPRYVYYGPANLPKVVKPVMVGDETYVDTHQVHRGGRGERALKEQRHVLGDPSMELTEVGTKVDKGYGEYITHIPCWWKSDRFVVAEKRGNACGAKGPNINHVSTKTRRSA